MASPCLINDGHSLRDEAFDEWFMEEPARRALWQEHKVEATSFKVWRDASSFTVIPLVADADVEATIEHRFVQLADEWQEETWHVSNPNELTRHPKYREIVDLGWDAVRLMLIDLQATDRFWFPALAEITKLRPYDPDDAGNVKRMKNAWIEWGKKKEII